VPQRRLAPHRPPRQRGRQHQARIARTGAVTAPRMRRSSAPAHRPPRHLGDRPPRACPNRPWHQARHTPGPLARGRGTDLRSALRRSAHVSNTGTGDPPRGREDCPTVCVTGRDPRVRDRASRAGEDHDRDHNFFLISVASPTSSEPGNSVGRSVSPVGDEPAMRDWAAELVERAPQRGCRPDRRQRLC
jgi:hypothetical protein